MHRYIIGAGKTSYPGWIPTQEAELDLLDASSFARVVGDEGSAAAFLAEHVFEHLTFEEAAVAAANLYKYLRPRGYARIAVPDKNFPPEWYQKLCRPGGPGPVDHPAYTHKVFYTVETLTDVLTRAGFAVDPLEFCDARGRFHFNYWDPADGMIGRSLRFDTRNLDGKLGMVSLIVDAVKPDVTAG